MPFVESAKEAFAVTHSTEISRRQVYVKQGYVMYGDVSGLIGLSGATTGTCALSLPVSLARSLMDPMLIVSKDEHLISSSSIDGVGMLITKIVGGAREKLAQTKHKFNFTLPTIISGGKHEIFHRSGAHCVVLLFDTPKGDVFTLDVCVLQK